MNDEATSNADRDDDTTDFGFTRVDREAKAGMVRGVFDSVASRYDVMNDVKLAKCGHQVEQTSLTSTIMFFLLRQLQEGPPPSGAV